MKTYELSFEAYKLVSAISANIATRDALSKEAKKETYKAIKAEFLELSEKDEKGAIEHFNKWLTELNAASGYVPKAAKKSAKAAKKTRATKEVKTPFVSAQMMQLANTLNTKAAPSVSLSAKPKKGVKEVVVNVQSEANNSALKDLYKEGLMSKAEIAHEYKQGHISLETMLEIVG